MDRSKFYAALRARSSGVFETSLSQCQVNGTEMVLDEAQRRGTPLRHLAYILSTTYLEMAHTVQPIREKGGEQDVPAVREVVAKTVREELESREQYSTNSEPFYRSRVAQGSFVTILGATALIARLKLWRGLIRYADGTFEAGVGCATGAASGKLAN